MTSRTCGFEVYMIIIIMIIIMIIIIMIIIITIKCRLLHSGLTEIAMNSPCGKSKVRHNLYSKLNLTMTRSIARAILYGA